MSRLKSFVSTVLAFSLCLSVSACKHDKKFDKLDVDSFRQILENNQIEYIDLRDSEYEKIEITDQATDDIELSIPCGERALLGFSGEDVYYSLIEFDDTSCAHEYFEQTYNYLQTKRDAYGLKKDMDMKLDENSGYILVDANCNEFKRYGGYFLKENTVVIVVSLAYTYSYQGLVDKFLDLIDYPKP